MRRLWVEYELSINRLRVGQTSVYPEAAGLILVPTDETEDKADDDGQ